MRSGDNLRVCIDCEDVLPLKAFWKNKTKCIKCSNIRRRYRISGADFYRMLHEQMYSCLICELKITDKTACIDHCHNNKNVRALLCSYCNTGIGFLKHDKHIAERAVEYLNKHT